VTILRTGASQKYSENWENIFSKKRATIKKSANKKKNTARGKKK